MAPGDIQHIQGQSVTHELFRSLLSQVCTQVATPNDQIFIYFAGHAFVDERSGDGYLALANTNYKDPQTALHLGTLMRQILPQCRASQVLLIFDCFQTGRLWSMRRTSHYDFAPLLGRTLSGSLQGTTSHILGLSCRGNEFAGETGERGLGTFAHRMIAALCGPATDPQSGKITFQRMQSILNQSKDEQHKLHIVGQFQNPFTFTGEMAPPAPAPNSMRQGSSPTHAAQQGLMGQATATQVAPPPEAAQQPNQTEQKNQQISQLLAQAQQLLQQSNQPQALQLIEQALQLDPANSEALTLKCQVLGTVGRTDEAFSTVDQLLQSDPNHALGWSMRAVLLNNSGQYQAALVAIERSLELNPNNPETYGIKTNIMASLATAQSIKGSPSTPLTPKQQPEKPTIKAFFGNLSLEIVGYIISIGGMGLLVALPSVPAIAGLLIASIGLGICCTQAARGAFRHGFKSAFFTLLLCVLSLALVGGAYQFGSTRLIGVFQSRPAIVEPTIFLAFWLVLTSVLLFLIAFFGYFSGLIRRLTKRR
ncbi:tetratricopeptide repeat protein [Ktedonospora formicarum]|uniref:Peptidase C14 caspase domain-containing protein n=1 Tax=Ktedonospora formicarum TaxID=2778364 RepID=A0A8J3HVN3_9CHLR|nr:tetratricopeptide repeat protein [Ktedonospora formicarum]GHO42841.1 hypothetical protein KSX_10040 [Ktedonospora formicarum]